MSRQVICFSPGSGRERLEGQEVAWHKATGRFGMPPRGGGGLCREVFGEMPLVFMLSKGIVPHQMLFRGLLLAPLCPSIPPESSTRRESRGWVSLWPGEPRHRPEKPNRAAHSLTGSHCDRSTDKGKFAQLKLQASTPLCFLAG